MRRIALQLLGISLGLAGCVPPLPTVDNNPDPDNNQNLMHTADMAPPGKPVCGAQTFPVSISTLPPNVYFAIDRSGSMSEAFGTTTRWDATKNAINTILGSNTGKASWGMSLFPSNPSLDVCGKAQVDVPMQLGSEAAILSRLNAITSDSLKYPSGATPTADALKTVRDLAGLAGVGRNNYAVLFTDGLPGCVAPGNTVADVSEVIDELYNRIPSVTTYVIGVGPEAAANGAYLDEWAQKGHSARVGGATKYYQVNDAAQVAAAFSDIIGEAAACTFHLENPPADPSLVVGKLDGVEIASDSVNGFTFDATRQSLVFHGTACDKIKQHKVTKVDAIYGCPPVVVL